MLKIRLFEVVLTISSKYFFTINLERKIKNFQAGVKKKKSSKEFAESEGNFMTLSERQVWHPPVELIETETELILKAEIPGVKISDLEVRTTKKSVSISGKHFVQHLTNKREVISSELHYGEIQYTVNLPVPIQNDRTEAELVDGILTLTMPKLPQSKEIPEKTEKTAIFSA